MIVWINHLYIVQRFSPAPPASSPDHLQHTHAWFLMPCSQKHVNTLKGGASHYCNNDSSFRLRSIYLSKKCCIGDYRCTEWLCWVPERLRSLNSCSPPDDALPSSALTHTHTHTHTRAASSERSTLLHPFKHVTLAQFGSCYRYPEICPASGRPVVYYSGSRLHPADHKHIHPYI